VAGLALLVLTALAGCVQVRVTEPSFDGFRELAEQRGSGGGQQGGQGIQLDKPGTSWAVRVATFSGSKRQQLAHDLLRQLTRQTDLGGFWISNLGSATTLYLGQYKKPKAPKAQTALRKVRGLQLKNGRRFPRARLVTVNRQKQQIQDRHNLRAYSGYYSLQVAYYDDNYQGDRQKAAKRNAKALRQQYDVSAYYYHGSNLSMVTVGLFGEQQAFEKRPDPLSPGRAKVRAYSSAVRNLQKRFPGNYANKPDIVELFQNNDAPEAEENSELVRVP
jgi:hypothetical protein